MKPPQPGPLRTALGPLSWLYGVWMRRRNARYDRPNAAARVAVPVISVGNLSAGGTGKTPLVRWLARTMLERHVPTAIVSRGYGGSAGAGPVVVSAGDGIRCPASVAGDEPWMLANSLDEAIVVVGSDRTAGARRAVELGARLVLLDDGFQHRRLARDIDIVLLDRTRPFHRDRLLPAGLLREPPASLARADWIVITRSGSPDGAERLETAIRSYNPSAAILHADHETEELRDAAMAVMPRPARTVAFCAIGNPERFRSDLERLGLEIAGFHAFADHRRIDAATLRRLRGQADDAGAELVTTEKDLARIGLDTAASFGLRVLPIRTVVRDGERLVHAIEERLRRQPG
ncbi:MAG: tetraacyldisaccharide 4'-kinase [Acidobacteria bacterium]|nr:tetraacyldisaccharide 4'-kinase [Acidobacteriota bacterium]NIM60785.1 tetraacyldisaccharide 4'-kinase [Acidobacteriota bacterium]NIQ83470.1 tetraacyldisaccharide 4'-kinase [Acidobacteriota bacterium]NIT09711.1 tetraacyldisaccharide 4'-kinase [Acidobacteriota bacterium]